MLPAPSAGEPAQTPTEPQSRIRWAALWPPHSPRLPVRLSCPADTCGEARGAGLGGRAVQPLAAARHCSAPPTPSLGLAPALCTHRTGHGTQGGANSGGQSSRPIQTEQTERPEPHEARASRGRGRHPGAAGGGGWTAAPSSPPRPPGREEATPTPTPTPTAPQRPRNMPARLGMPGVLGGASVATIPELGRERPLRPDQTCQGVRGPRAMPAASPQPCCPAPMVRPDLLLPPRKTAAGRRASAKPRARGAQPGPMCPPPHTGSGQSQREPHPTAPTHPSRQGPPLSCPPPTPSRPHAASPPWTLGPSPARLLLPHLSPHHQRPL